MPTQSVVRVFALDAAGQMAAQLGTGVLVHPQVVLVHRPVNVVLLDDEHGEPAQVRVQLEIGDAHSLEQIDVDKVLVIPADVDGSDPLVALDLAHASTADVWDLPGLDDDTDRDGLIAAARTAVAGSPPKAEQGVVTSLRMPPHPNSRSLFCSWLGIGCPKNP